MLVLFVITLADARTVDVHVRRAVAGAVAAFEGEVRFSCVVHRRHFIHERFRAKVGAVVLVFRVLQLHELSGQQVAGATELQQCKVQQQQESHACRCKGHDGWHGGGW